MWGNDNNSELDRFNKKQQLNKYNHFENTVSPFFNKYYGTLVLYNNNNNSSNACTKLFAGATLRPAHHHPRVQRYIIIITNPGE